MADIFENPSIIAEAQSELKEALGGAAYVCPIPPGVKPKLAKIE